MKKYSLSFLLMFSISFNIIAQGDFVQILPANPTINDDVKIITYKCNYDVTSYKLDNNNSILLTVYTNSLIKAPCKPVYDTITIGKLSKGNWTLNYFYLDRANVLGDSIIYTKSISFTVSLLSSLQEDLVDTKWKIYPNPTDEFITIENNLGGDDNFISIIDMQGKLLLKKYLHGRYGRIDISNFKEGSYFIRLNSDKTIGYKKIIIK